MKEINAKSVRRMFKYDPETGVLTWAIRVSQAVSQGDTAGHLHASGYRRVGINRRPFLAHRIIWLWMTGHWPSMQIDHINGNKQDNRWSNLRDVPPSTNSQNLRRCNENNRSSRLLGTTFSKKERAWVAQISVHGKRLHLGKFKDPESAHAAYVEAKRRLHPGCTI